MTDIPPLGPTTAEDSLPTREPEPSTTQGKRPKWPRDTRMDRYDWTRSRGDILAFGESKTLAEWATDTRCSVKRDALRTRLALGWEPETAITRAKHEKPALEFTHNDRTLTLHGWAEQSGIKYHTLYNRITQSGLSFTEALEKGPDGPHFALPLTAFGETKALYRWGVDARAGCTTTTLRKRLAAGWDPEQAITEEPENRARLGDGTPHSAFGRRMGLEDWGRLTHIPADIIRRSMRDHATLDSTLRTLGWTPDCGEPAPAEDPRSGDHARARPPKPGDAPIVAPKTSAPTRPSTADTARSRTTAPAATPTAPTPSTTPRAAGHNAFRRNM
ncbi:hypothetical protein [Streptomyces sp. SID3343]|uniref:hypothetical protein n=1 Tax=Streptomyces sp. SID3343 TaxID=2690260 RepID=UPI001370FAAD|nr:hypothetical protein [Streptomyces sp. SID3343]MYW06200.1 hypothetical protein [Streptomyces sp. SID3343]